MPLSDKQTKVAVHRQRMTSTENYRINRDQLLQCAVPIHCVGFLLYRVPYTTHGMNKIH